MKVKVLTLFVDRDNPLTSYQPGTILDWDNPDRIKAGTDNGLIEVLEKTEKPKTAKKARKQ